MLTDGRTDDGRTDDGRTTDAGVTGILIAHLGAFGSGELKKNKHTGAVIICKASTCFEQTFFVNFDLGPTDCCCLRE